MSACIYFMFPHLVYAIYNRDSYTRIEENYNVYYSTILGKYPYVMRRKYKIEQFPRRLFFKHFQEIIYKIRNVWFHWWRGVLVQLVSWNIYFLVTFFICFFWVGPHFRVPTHNRHMYFVQPHFPNPSIRDGYIPISSSNCKYPSSTSSSFSTDVKFQHHPTIFLILFPHLSFIYVP